MKHQPHQHITPTQFRYIGSPSTIISKFIITKKPCDKKHFLQFSILHHIRLEIRTIRHVWKLGTRQWLLGQLFSTIRLSERCLLKSWINTEMFNHYCNAGTPARLRMLAEKESQAWHLILSLNSSISYTLLGKYSCTYIFICTSQVMLLLVSNMERT